MTNAPLNSVRALACLLGAVVLLVLPGAAGAQGRTKTPTMPEPLKTLEEQGAQVRYMGTDFGMDSWIAIQRGQEQFFYVTPDGKGMVMGLLFAMDGKLVTMDQVRKIQIEEGATLDLFADQPAGETPSVAATMADAAPATAPVTSPAPEAAAQSPSENLMAAIESSNWITLGQAGAPPVYAFVDPQCPYCHAFIEDMNAQYLPNGAVQLRLIPVGFRDETRAQAAYLLGAPDAAARFMRYIGGEEAALPVSYDISQQAVERNMAVMQNWKLNVTPLIVYRAADGTVKIIQGRPKDAAALIADLP